MDFWRTQPKLCASFVAGRRRPLAIWDLWKTSLDGIGYYFIPEEEAEWRKSLFA
jgi:hypothetical protein